MKKSALAFFIFFCFVSTASMASQFIPYLNEVGFSSLSKNALLAGSAILTFILAFYLGKKSDSEGVLKPSLKITLFGFLLIVILSWFVDFMFVKGILLGIMFALIRSVMSLSETLILSIKKKKFPQFHSFAAIGMITGSLLVGSRSLAFRYVVCIISLLMAFFFLGKIKEERKEPVQISLDSIQQLLQNKNYLLILGLFFFLMMIGYADQYIVVDKMTALGASSVMISMKYAIQASMEIPVYLGMNLLFSKIKTSSLLLICILMSGVKFFLYGWADQASFIVVISLLQIVTHPLIVVLSKSMIQKITPKDLMATSQIVGSAFYLGLSGIVTPILSQILSVFLNQDQILYVFAILTLFPLILWFFVRKYDKVNMVMKMKTYLIDLDGTMYRGNENIDGAREFIAYCLKQKIPFYFLTNNATRTKKQNREHMEKLGFSGIQDEHFFTSSMAAARTMRKLGYTKAQYIGQDGLYEALIENDFVISETPECLFVGLDKKADYEKYSKALQYLLKGAKLVGTNSDRLLANGDTFTVGNGAIVDMFEYASGQKSMKIGKPNAPILNEALEYFQLKKEECILLGDNLETDIALGVNEHVATILVTSGVHHEDDVQRLKIYPDRIVASLYELIEK